MNSVVVLMLVLVGLMDTSMASKGSRGHRGQERRTTSCSSVRIFNQRLQACLKDARKQIRMLDEDKNESMKTIKELEIKNQNLDVEAKKCDAEKHNCMVNSDILEGENKRLKEQIESDPCLSVSCGTNGTCYSNGASYICECLSGWSGPSCNVSPLDCDFDVNTCTWVQGDTDDFNWSRISGSTPSNNTGPNGDHTTGNGFYMFIEATDTQPGNRADLVSTLLASGHTYCMEIALSMYGNTMGDINVYTKPEQEGMAEVLIQQFQQETNSPKWYTRIVTIPSQTDDFRIVIAGVRGNNWASDAAIDDIRLIPGAC